MTTIKISVLIFDMQDTIEGWLVTRIIEKNKILGKLAQLIFKWVLGELFFFFFFFEKLGELFV